MIRETDFLRDFNSGRNADEARELKWWILAMLRKWVACTADEIYEKSGCGDIAMYLCLHELIVGDIISGPDPYDDGVVGNHRDWVYTLTESSQSDFFSKLAELMVDDWDPKEWNDFNVCAHFS